MPLPKEKPPCLGVGPGQGGICALWLSSPNLSEQAQLDWLRVALTAATCVATAWASVVCVLWTCFELTPRADQALRVLLNAARARGLIVLPGFTLPEVRLKRALAEARVRARAEGLGPVARVAPVLARLNAVDRAAVGISNHALQLHRLVVEALSDETACHALTLT